MQATNSSLKIKPHYLLTFIAITLFYFFEAGQMSYFNVLAPYFLKQHIYQHNEIASLSAAYYYGDMIGLIPVGLALDRFPLRKLLLWAILGSVVGALLLLLSHNYELQWTARFICGFFGGTFSFIGGIRVLAGTFSKRFSLYMSLFLSAGMFGGLICQYPLLVVIKDLGVSGAIGSMVAVGVFVGLFNLFFLHPVENNEAKQAENRDRLSVAQTYLLILKNFRNWLDCLMVSALDTPVSIIGTLWGIVFLMGFYHFSAEVSSWIIMALFAGLILGLPFWGGLADRLQHSKWIIICGASTSLVLVALMLLFQQTNAIFVAVLFLGLGFFSSCQTLGFTWLTKNMKPELIGKNSSVNSMIFMGVNGGFKQLAAYLLTVTSFAGMAKSGNLLMLIAVVMLLAVIYAFVRKIIFKNLVA